MFENFPKGKYFLKKSIEQLVMTHQSIEQLVVTHQESGFKDVKHAAGCDGPKHRRNRNYAVEKYK